MVTHKRTKSSSPKKSHSVTREESVSPLDAALRSRINDLEEKLAKGK